MKNNNTDLRTLIKRSGLRRDFIAKQLGIHYKYLDFIINGQRKASKTRKRLINFLLAQISLNSRKAA